MKTLEFKKASWHYRLAKKAGYEEDGDFCTYVRSFLWGALLMVLLTALVLFGLYALGRLSYSAYTCSFTKVCTYGEFEKTVLMGIGVIIGCVAYIYALIWVQNRRWRIRGEIRRGERPEPGPSFVAMAYKSYKEKTCFKVEFK
jgi:amino acid transporter